MAKVYVVQHREVHHDCCQDPYLEYDEILIEKIFDSEEKAIKYMRKRIKEEYEYINRISLNVEILIRNNPVDNPSYGEDDEYWNLVYKYKDCMGTNEYYLYYETYDVE